MTPRAARGRLIFRERPTVAAVTTLTALSVGETIQGAAALKVSRRLVVVALTFQLETAPQAVARCRLEA